MQPSGVHGYEPGSPYAQALLRLTALDPEKRVKILCVPSSKGSKHCVKAVRMLISKIASRGLNCHLIICLRGWLHSANKSAQVITDADGDIASNIHLTDKASKGRGGRADALELQSNRLTGRTLTSD